MKIRLRQLRAFVELAKTQNFTQAAQNLFITQSALSSLIKQMEVNLGLQLFDRSTRNVQLTDVGQDLYPYIDQILQDLANVLEEAANLKALKKAWYELPPLNSWLVLFCRNVLLSFSSIIPRFKCN